MLTAEALLGDKKARDLIREIPPRRRTQTLVARGPTISTPD